MHKSFRQGGAIVRALRGIDLSIHAGELTLIEGPSGSGKTTLLQILGLLQRPDEGEVWIRGKRLDHLDERVLPAERRRNIVFIFQGSNLLESLTVEENVAVAGMLRGERLRGASAEPHLQTVQMTDRAGHLPSQLSGGERQRTAIARALASPGLLVLADEPTANLDWSNAERVVAELAELARVGGRAVVLVSHDSRLEAFADRIVRMLDGAVSVEQRLRDAPMNPTVDTADRALARARPSRGSRWLPRAALAAVAFGIVLYFGWGSWFGAAPAAPPSRGGPAASVTPYAAAAPAVVEPCTQLVAVRSERAGRIKSIKKRAGERIVTGEPLVLLDDATAKTLVEQAAADLKLAEADLANLLAWQRKEERGRAKAMVDRAQARLDRATRERKRVEGLHTDNSASETEFDKAVEDERFLVATLAEAKHSLEIAESGPTVQEIGVAQARVDKAGAALHVSEAQLGLCTIASPLDGHVVYRHLEPGEVVDPQSPTPILSVGNLDRLRLRAEVDEADIVRVMAGQTVEATAEAFGDRKFHGRVVHMEPLMGPKNIRTNRTTERRDVQVREVLVELDDADVTMPIGLQMTVRFLATPTTQKSGG